MTETKTENGVQTEVTSYSYDQRGGRTYTDTTKVNDTSENWCSYYWSPRGELMSCDGISVSSLYSYDALGRRIYKFANGTTEYFTWSGDQEMASINNGVTTDRYIYGVQGIAMTGSMYYIKNGHGDVIEVVDLGDTPRGGYIYEAFGETMETPSTDTGPFKYCGEYYDEESGLIYLRNRYYDPSTGAFISEDDYWTPSNMIHGDEQKTLDYVDNRNIKNYEDIDKLYKKTVDISKLLDRENKKVSGSDKFKFTNVNIASNYTTQTLPNSIVIKQSANLYIYSLNNPIIYVDSMGNVASVIVATAPTWLPYVVAGVTTVIGGIILFKEHSTNKTKSNLNKHQKGQTRKQKDAGGEKGDTRRTPRKDKRK